MTTTAIRIHTWFDIGRFPFALGTSDSGHGSGAAPTQRRADQVNLPLPGVVARAHAVSAALSTFLRASSVRVTVITDLGVNGSPGSGPSVRSPVSLQPTAGRKSLRPEPSLWHRPRPSRTPWPGQSISPDRPWAEGCSA